MNHRDIQLYEKLIRDREAERDAALAHAEAMDGKLKELREYVLEELSHAMMASHSGGDNAMVFDHDDAIVEAARKGWYSMDRTCIEALKDTLATTPDPIEAEERTK